MMFTSTHQKKIAGFTLVELLVVIAILALIGSIVGPQVLKQFSGAKVDAAKLQIQDLSSSLDLFFLDVGRYPNTSEGLSSLLKSPAGLSTWDGPYLKDNMLPSDPWGNTFGYQYPGEFSTYDLISYGADSQAGGESDNADISNAN